MRSIGFVKAALIAVCLTAFSSGVALAGIDIYVDKSSQRMTVTVDGVKRYTWKVSTGKFGYATPSGTFHPFRMEPTHFSEEWDNAPMPHSIFFTYQGHAIHGSYSSRLGRPVSHGCIRLSPRNAATLYSLVSREGMNNTNITVAGGGISISNQVAPITRSIKKAIPEATKYFGYVLREKQRERGQ